MEWDDFDPTDGITEADLKNAEFEVWPSLAPSEYETFIEDDEGFWPA